MEREIYCKSCGKKLLTYDEKKHVAKYESPAKKCSGCGEWYLDPRCHEIAVEGVPAGLYNVTPHIIMVLIGVLVAYRGCRGFGDSPLETISSGHWILPAVIIIVGLGLLIYGAVQALSIEKGTRRRHYETLRLESEARMMDKNYVELLKKLGYRMMDKRG